MPSNQNYTGSYQPQQNNVPVQQIPTQGPVAIPPTKTVVVKKVIKKGGGPMAFLAYTVFLLLILLIVVVSMSFTGWMYTFKVLTEEQVVAELKVSPKEIRNEVPYFTVTYTPKNQNQFLPEIFGKAEAKSITSEFAGDIVYVDSQFMRWQNWGTMVGFKPVYKIFRVKSDYVNSNYKDRYKTSFFDIDGGADEMLNKFDTGDKSYDWIISTVYFSSAGKSITNEERTYKVIVTKDAIVLE